MVGTNNSDRSRLWAGVLLAVLAVLCVVPGVSVFAAWLLPVPVLVYRVRGPRYAAPVAALVATACTALGGFGFSSLLFGAAVYFLGWVMGESFVQADSPYAPLVIGTLVFSMLELVLLALLHWSGVDFFNTVKVQLLRSITANHAVLPRGETAVSTVATVVNWLKLMIPALLVLIGFFAAAANLLLSRLILGKSDGWQPLLLHWRLPNGVVTVYIVSLAAVLFGLFRDATFMWQSLNCALFLTGFFIGVQGLAWLWRRLYERPLSYLWIVILCGLGLVRLIGSVYILIGLLDSMRRIRRAGP